MWMPTAIPDCSVCGGEGFVRSYTLGESTDDPAVRLVTGTVVIPCPAAGCLGDQFRHSGRARHHWEQERHDPHTFDNFERRPGTEEALDCAQQLAEGRATFHLLLIHGPVACGKTHLLYAVRHALSQRGIAAYYSLCDEFLADYLLAISIGASLEFLARAEAYSCLVLDEWKEYMPGAESGCLELVLAHRLAHGLPTVLALQDIRLLPERLFAPFNDPQGGSRIVMIRRIAEGGNLMQKEGPDTEVKLKKGAMTDDAPTEW